MTAVPPAASSSRALALSVVAFTLCAIALAGLIVRRSTVSPTCRAAFQWQPRAADSSYLVMMHPECAVGVQPPVVERAP